MPPNGSKRFSTTLASRTVNTACPDTNGRNPVYHPPFNGLVRWDRHFMLDVRRLQRRFEEQNNFDLRDIKGDGRQMTECLLWERTRSDSSLATGGDEQHHDHDCADR